MLCNHGHLLAHVSSVVALKNPPAAKRSWWGTCGDTEITPRTQIVSAAYAFNADKLDGYDAADFFTPGAPGEPTGVFRCYGDADHSTVTVCGSSSVTREITSILASTSQLGGGYLKVGGDVVMVFEFTNESKTETWYRGHGPGIIVQPGEAVELWAPNYQIYITVLGYEY